MTDLIELNCKAVKQKSQRYNKNEIAPLILLETYLANNKTKSNVSNKTLFL